MILRLRLKWLAATRHLLHLSFTSQAQVLLGTGKALRPQRLQCAPFSTLKGCYHEDLGRNEIKFQVLALTARHPCSKVALAHVVIHGVRHLPASVSACGWDCLGHLVGPSKPLGTAGLGQNSEHMKSAKTAHA